MSQMTLKDPFRLSALDNSEPIWKFHGPASSISAVAGFLFHGKQKPTPIQPPEVFTIPQFFHHHLLALAFLKVLAIKRQCGGGERLLQTKNRSKEKLWLIGCSLKPRWPFVIGCPWHFDFVPWKRAQASSVLVCLHRPPWH